MSVREKFALYQAVADDLAAGMSALAAATKHGLAVPTIYRIRDDWGIPVRGRNGGFRQVETEERRAARQAARELQQAWLAEKMADRVAFKAKLEVRRDQIVARFEAGETLQVIGAAFGITRERVRQIVRIAGQKPRNQQSRERRAAMVEQMRSEGMTAKAAAERFGFAPTDAHRVAREFGYALRPEPRLIDEPRFAEMAELVRGGMSMRRAAGGDHSTEAALARYCEEHGIKSLHGRWRVREERAALVRVMRAAHLTWAQIAEELSAVEGYAIGKAAIQAWSKNHLSRGDYEAPKRPPKPPAERRARGVGKGKGPRLPVAVCDEVREAARLNYGKAPASEIAKAHGVTRNVIIGHWFRLRRAGLLPSQNEAAA